MDAVSSVNRGVLLRPLLECPHSNPPLGATSPRIRKRCGSGVRRLGEAEGRSNGGAPLQALSVGHGCPRATSVSSPSECSYSEVCIKEIRRQFQKPGREKSRETLWLQKNGRDIRSCRQHFGNAAGDSLASRSSCGDGPEQVALCSGRWDCAIHQGSLRATSPQQRKQGGDLPIAQRSRAVQNFY